MTVRVKDKTTGFEGQDISRDERKIICKLFNYNIGNVTIIKLLFHSNTKVFSVKPVFSNRRIFLTTINFFCFVLYMNTETPGRPFLNCIVGYF